MQIPTTLKHKPVVVCENYENIDGRSAYQSEAKGLSAGLAQWNDRGRIDISTKVWRHTGEKWSRQSEELPMHRVLDMAIFTLRTYQYFLEAYRFEKLYDPENPKIDRIGLQATRWTCACALKIRRSTGISGFLRRRSQKTGSSSGSAWRCLPACSRKWDT
jgi:hypothetical protein